MKKTYKPLIGDDGEVRPLSAHDRPRARMLRDSFPELAEYAKKRRVGRPKVESPKKSKSFKLSQDLIEAIIASGRGYNARVEASLREALAKGKI